MGRWGIRFLSLIVPGLALDLILEITSLTDRMEQVAKVAWALLPGIGFALLCASPVLLWAAWGPKVTAFYRKHSKRHQFRALVPEIEEHMKFFEEAGGYERQNLTRPQSRKYILFLPTLERFGIKPINIEGFFAWGMLLRCAAEGDYKKARSIRPSARKGEKE